MTFFEKNIRVLEKIQPALVKRVENFIPSAELSVVPSRNGLPVPHLGSVSLHSIYDPTKEAVDSVAGFEADSGLVVYGLGFGYHIAELLKKGSGHIQVIEPSMSLFHNFLTHIELYPVFLRCRFHVG